MTVPNNFFPLVSLRLSPYRRYPDEFVRGFSVMIQRSHLAAALMLMPSELRARRAASVTYTMGQEGRFAYALVVH
jgi:hypothetical protein